MAAQMQMSRRDLIKLGLLGTAALYLPIERLAKAGDVTSTARLPAPFTYPFTTPPSIDMRGGGQLQLAMRQVPGSLLGGPAGVATYPKTNLWAYTYGTPGASDFKINPTIHVKKDVPISIKHANALPATHPQHGYTSWTSVHLHGSASLPQYDGYASDVIKSGQSKTYHYPNAQGARTLWYHDHGVHRTAKNAYAGLAGQYHLHDDMEAASGIPVGEPYDVPLTIRDALFTSNGTLLWDDNSESSLMGDVILVNGVPWPYMDVKRRMYRFRMLNASISRSFKLSVSDPRVKMYVIASDGGFLPKPVQVSSFRLGMAERYEVILDFTECDPGTTGAKIMLQSAEVKNNVDYAHTRKIMQFRIPAGAPKVDVGVHGNKLPPYFYSSTAPKAGNGYMGPDEVMGLTASMAVRQRHFKLERSNSMWTINGVTWDQVVASGYTRTLADVAPGSIEIWNWENSSGGWFHPLHIHLVDFKILRRSGGSGRVEAYEAGPKDVAYVGEGETMSLIMRFGPHTGRYMVHCHNLVHEDHDMMGQYRVGTDTPDNDPINAAKAY